MGHLSIVIPAYNEEKRIGDTLNKIKDYITENKIDSEIIVVNDGSSDNTSSIVKKHRDINLIELQKNKGKGNAVKIGMLNAKNPLILFSDADLSTPIEELENFIKHIKENDIVIGSRALKESNIEIKQPLPRVLMGKTFNKILQLILIRGIKDTQCGFKLFKKEYARDLFKKQSLSGWGFDGEILFLAKKKKFKIKEVPVTWRNATGSKVNPIRDSYSVLKDTIKIRINNFKGKYD